MIGYTNAGTATVIQCTGIVFIMLATCILKRRLPRWQETVGLLLACGATWLLATGGDPTRIALPVPGLIWGLANGLSVAFYIMYPKKLLATHGSMVVTGFGMLIGGIAATCIAVPQTSWPALDGAGVAALLAIVVLGTAVAFGLYMQGVADAGAVRAGMLGVSEPVSATLISWLWLGTAFSAADLVGFAMMIAMVLIITRMQDA